MSAIFLKLHLGLGDLVICNGMIRVLAERHGRIIVPAKPHNEATARWMFSDDKRIEVCRVENDQDMLKQAEEWDSIGIGLWSKHGLESDWSNCFYRHSDVPLECRWSEFKLPHSFPAFLTGSHWFVHDDRSRGYVIKLPRVEGWRLSLYPDPKLPFQESISPLQSAAEIHVIDSCFLCLADSIETNAKRHVLHAYATAHDPYKKFGPPTLRKNWEILK